ncbi:universal stress protein [Edaphobacter aggregans]|uniref:universal stress protein n=1 Tax=Edaphobacter aggregans TaxID=570835 RepID=UPI000551940F|nr:universal stress protein [Edaphobacter aggregans]
MQTPIPSFKKLLVATDFSASSGTAFQVALNLCNELGASLLVLHAFEYGSVVPPETGGQLIAIEDIYEKARQSLNDLLTRAQQVGVVCEISIERGIASPRILDKIRSAKIDLAILGTNSLKGFERFVFGSTAEEVLRKSPCPVVTVGPRVFNAEVTVEGPIVFATDFDRSTIHAIHSAASLGRLTKSSVHCLHVVPRIVGRGGQHSIIPEVMNETLQRVVSESGADITRPICVTTYDDEISNGIVDYARKEKARLIVLGVRQASMIASHAPAHIAYQVISAAPCPVMTVAFSSPSHSRSVQQLVSTTL